MASANGVVHAYIPTYLGGKGGRVQGWSQGKSARPFQILSERYYHTGIKETLPGKRKVGFWQLDTMN
jgi:hypothetical protein